MKGSMKGSINLILSLTLAGGANGGCGSYEGERRSVDQFDAGKSPPFIAHRGESFDAPENTPAAFDLAWQREDDAIELDLHLSADGQVVVCHDPDTLRTAGVRQVIRESTLADLRSLDIGLWKDAKWAGQRIATLGEVLDRTPAGKQVFVEIKSGPETVEPVASVLARFPSVITAVIAFDLDVVRVAKEQLPRHRVYWLVSPKRDESSGQWSPTPDEMIQKAQGVGADGLNVDAAFPIDAGFVDSTHAKSMGFYVWTVDDPTRARELIDLGVDGITTNRAAWMREQFKQVSGRQ